jgi:hypothetical protein
VGFTTLGVADAVRRGWEEREELRKRMDAEYEPFLRKFVNGRVVLTPEERKRYRDYARTGVADPRD